MTQVTHPNAEHNAEAGADRALPLMVALIAAATVLGALTTLLFDGVAWYEAALPGALAGIIFILQTRWSLKKVTDDPLSALKVTMAGMGVHFGVIIIGGLAFVLGANFNPIAVFGSMLAAFAVCQPLGTAALRRRIQALPTVTRSSGASTSNSISNPTRTPFAEASA